MIAATDLTKEYGDNQALAGVSFDVAPGTICAYLGPNGAGKSTTVKILTGVMRPTSGRAVVAGFDVQESPVEVKRRIGYVPENAHLYMTLSVAEYFALVGTFHRIAPASVDERGRKMLELFDIPKALNKRIGSLSKGQKQKVLISGALIHDPEVLIFDEPLSGLDANATQAVKQIVREMADRRKTVFYCSHMLDVVERLCDRVIVIDQGTMIANDTPAGLIERASAASLEEAFRRLTGGDNMEQRASEFADAVRTKR
ncbi:MAG: ABC transporter ATP-binding protein [Planctomycetota bacterium]